MLRANISATHSGTNFEQRERFIIGRLSGKEHMQRLYGLVAFSVAK